MAQNSTWNDMEVMACIDKLADKTLVGAERRSTVWVLAHTCVSTRAC
jgi:hypothetical protein